jgi:pimeloyl-ACP methyl ester carboxylesterase
MESHWIYKAHIIGHSMGGKTAMQFALQYPDMVDKLIVLDIAPKDYKGGHEVILETLESIDLTKIQDRKEAESFMLARIPDFGTRQFLLKNLTRNEKTAAFEWKMNLVVLQREYDAILANVDDGIYDGDTLFVRGQKSDYIIDAEIPNIKAKFPNMQLETIENAGHWVHADQPKQLLEIIQRYLMA